MPGDAFLGTGPDGGSTGEVRQSAYPSSERAHSDRQFVDQLTRLYASARRSKQDKYDRWTRNVKLINNQIGGAPTPWAPAPRDSEIYPTISALVAWMTDQNTIIDALPAADPGSPFYQFISGLCNDLGNVIYSTWQNEDYDAQIKLSLWDAFTFGTGILKNCWDNSLSGGMGNAIIKRVDPYSFFPDPNATSLADCEFMVEVREMSKNEVERRFPNSAALLDASRGTGGEKPDTRPTSNSAATSSSNVSGLADPNPGSLPSGNGNWSGPRRNSQRTDTLPTVVVYEYWLRENEFTEEEYEDYDEEERPQLAERHSTDCWRVVVVANGEILMDEYADELWSHGSHPYERYVFDDIGEFYGVSLVDHLAYPQIYINRLLTSLQQNAELTGNPIFLNPANSGLSRTNIMNRPGQRLDVSPASMANGQGPKWLSPPEMPKSILDLIQFWISRIENVSGLSAIVKGATPNQRNSEGVMSSIQEAAFVRIRAGLRNLEKTLERCTVKIADLIVDNYTEPRIMAIVGPSGQQTSMALRSRHFYAPTEHGASPMKYTIQITAGASAPTSRQARTAEADKLFAMGGIDRQALLEAHQYPHLQDILTRIKQDPNFAPPGARQRSQRKS